MFGVASFLVYAFLVISLVLALVRAITEPTTKAWVIWGMWFALAMAATLHLIFGVPAGLR